MSQVNIHTDICMSCPIQQKCCYNTTLALNEVEMQLFPDKTARPEYGGRLTEEETRERILQLDEAGIPEWEDPLLSLPPGWCQHFNQDRRICNLGNRRPQVCKFFMCEYMQKQVKGE